MMCGALCRSIPEGFEGVTEGKATVLSQGNSVFYNRAQVVNRDISIAVLRWFIQQNREVKKQRRRQGGGVKPAASATVKVSHDWAHSCARTLCMLRAPMAFYMWDQSQ